MRRLRVCMVSGAGRCRVTQPGAPRRICDLPPVRDKRDANDANRDDPDIEPRQTPASCLNNLMKES